MYPKNDNSWLDTGLPNFSQKGNCTLFDPEMWFMPDDSESGWSRANRLSMWRRTPEYKQAKELCGACPIRQECLDYSLKYFDLHGIWGGLDDRERRMLQEREHLLRTRIVRSDSIGGVPVERG